MASMRRLALAQAPRPAGDLRRPVAAGDATVGDTCPVGLDDRAKAARQHPVEHLERRHRERQAERLLPHLLLSPAQEEDAAAPVGCHQPAAQPQQPVERAGGIAVRSQHVAQHDQPVAGPPARQHGAGEGLEGVVVAQQGPEGPDAAAAAQASDGWWSGHGGAVGNMKKAARRISVGRLSAISEPSLRQATFCSTLFSFCVARSLSMRSTAASSRASRSSAAS